MVDIVDVAVVVDVDVVVVVAAVVVLVDVAVAVRMLAAVVGVVSESKPTLEKASHYCRRGVAHVG